MLSFLVLDLLLLHQGSTLDLLGRLQHSADPLLISSCLWHEKKPLAFYKVNLEHKNGGMTKCLEKPLYIIPNLALDTVSIAVINGGSNNLGYTNKEFLSTYEVTKINKGVSVIQYDLISLTIVVDRKSLKNSILLEQLFMK